MCDIDPQLRAKIDQENRRRARKLGLWSIAVGVLGNLDTLSYTYSLVDRPAGSTIEPMSWAIYSCGWMVLAPLVVIPLAVSAILVGRRWWLGVLGISLGVALIFGPTLVFRYIVAARHLVIESSSR